jgi:hypothetical protein
MAIPITERKKKQVLELLKIMPKKKRKIGHMTKLSHETVYKIAREYDIINQYKDKKSDVQASILTTLEQRLFVKEESDRLNITMYRMVTKMIDALENHKGFLILFKPKTESSVMRSNLGLDYHDKIRIEKLSKSLNLYNYQVLHLAIRLYKESIGIDNN